MRRVIVITISLFILIIASLFTYYGIFYHPYSIPTPSINEINLDAEENINKVFSKKDKWLAIYPESRNIIIEKGSGASGFAFAIRNKEEESNTYYWDVSVDAEFDSKCGIEKSEAQKYLLLDNGIFRVGNNENNYGKIIMILFDIPQFTPNCTIPYKFRINDLYNNSVEEVVYVNIV
jgi:hypothetical protein